MTQTVRQLVAMPRELMDEVDTLRQALGEASGVVMPRAPLIRALLREALAARRGAVHEADLIKGRTKRAND